MRKHEELIYEPGLIMIFRLFCGAVSIVFFIFSTNPPLFYSVRLAGEIWFSMGAAYTFVFIYLIIPLVQKFLGRFFLPIAIASTIIIPILSLSWQPYLLEGPYIELLLSSSYSISILLMFPLIITAWQYNFRVVILFFVLLGGIDPLLYLILGQPAEQSAAAGLYSSLIRIVSFVAIGFVITELMKNQRNRQEELTQANNKLKHQAHFAQELSAARERNRLAHELHDVLAHTLSSLAVQLEAIKATIPPEETQTQQMLDKTIQNTRSGLQETRRSVRNLRSEPLEELGFQQALANACREAENRGGFTVKLHINIVQDTLAYAIKHAAFRISHD
nr:histidine kinase [Spirochaetales bacterium]